MHLLPGNRGRRRLPAVRDLSHLRSRDGSGRCASSRATSPAGLRGYAWPRSRNPSTWGGSGSGAETAARSASDTAAPEPIRILLMAPRSGSHRPPSRHRAHVFPVPGSPAPAPPRRPGSRSRIPGPVGSSARPPEVSSSKVPIDRPPTTNRKSYAAPVGGLGQWHDVGRHSVPPRARRPVRQHAREISGAPQRSVFHARL